MLHEIKHMHMDILHDTCIREIQNRLDCEIYWNFLLLSRTRAHIGGALVQCDHAGFNGNLPFSCSFCGRSPMSSTENAARK